MDSTSLGSTTIYFVYGHNSGNTISASSLQTDSVSPRSHSRRRCAQSTTIWVLMPCVSVTLGSTTFCSLFFFGSRALPLPPFSDTELHHLPHCSGPRQLKCCMGVHYPRESRISACYITGACVHIVRDSAHLRSIALGFGQQTQGTAIMSWISLTHGVSSDDGEELQGSLCVEWWKVVIGG
ncbi:hypothetical protein F4604DRAFT_378476 [Suillus subluteus]|nr:hypothetical protein F4604DRAFT_378476 [Suillus subluteus]